MRGMSKATMVFQGESERPPILDSYWPFYGCACCAFHPMFVCFQIPWVRIQTRQREVLSNKRILVAMDSWPAWCRYPLGHYVKTLGEKGAKATETEVRVLNRVRSIPTDNEEWLVYLLRQWCASRKAHSRPNDETFEVAMSLLLYVLTRRGRGPVTLAHRCARSSFSSTRSLTRAFQVKC